MEKDNLYVKLELIEDKDAIAERYCYLVYPKDLKLPSANIETSVVVEGGKTVLTVKSDVLAKDVEIISENASGTFSDNFFDLEAGEAKQIIFTTESDKTGEKFVFSTRSLNQ